MKASGTIIKMVKTMGHKLATVSTSQNNVQDIYTNKKGAKLVNANG